MGQRGLVTAAFQTAGKGWFCEGLSVAEAGFSSINSGLHGQPRLCPFGPGLSPDSLGSLLAMTPPLVDP